MTPTRSKRVPTEKQFRKLMAIGIHYTVLVPGRRDWGPLLKHGWVEALEADDGGTYLPPLRISADGLRALADCVERYEHPQTRWEAEKKAAAS